MSGRSSPSHGGRAQRILGLPVRAPRPLLACAALVLVVLLATMPHAIGLFDEGELAVAAYELGLGHPFGQPLHVLLGFVFAHLPGVAPATGLVMLSAVFAALATIPAIVLAERAMPPDGRVFLPAATVGAVALHGALWEASTRIEVYPIAAFFALYALALLANTSDATNVTNATDPPEGGDGPAASRAFLRAGLALGLAASANPIIAVAAFLATIPLLPAWLAAAPRARLLGRGALGGLAGLAPYLYLAVASRRSGALVWGGLSSWSEVVHYLSGSDYGGNLGAPVETRIDHALELLGHLANGRSFSPAMLIGALGIAVVAFTPHRRAIAVSMVASVVLPLAFVASNAVFRVDVPDYLGYLTVAMLVLGAASASAIDAALRRTPFAWLFLAALGFGAVFGTPVAWERSRRADDVTSRVAVAVLDEAPRDSIVVLESDHLVAPLLYVQRVEHHRRDVVVVIRGLMSSEWYVRWLTRTHPSLRRFAVHGRGGRDARIARLIAANATRDVRVEHLDLARALGRHACPGGLTLPAPPPGTGCAITEPAFGAFVRLANRAHRLPDGSLDARSVITAVSYRLAIDLFRFGRSRDAYVVLVAGLPPDYRVGLPPPDRIAPDDRLEGALPVFRRERALGEPARNAFVAAHLLSRAGEVDAAIALTERAAEDGLPEAIELLRRASR